MFMCGEFSFTDCSVRVKNSLSGSPRIFWFSNIKDLGVYDKLDYVPRCSMLYPPGAPRSNGFDYYAIVVIGGAFNFCTSLVVSCSCYPFSSSKSSVSMDRLNRGFPFAGFFVEG
jgi:hypothetical protein